MTKNNIINRIKNSGSRLISTLGFLVVVMAWPSASQAANGVNLSITPASAAATQANNFTVTLQVNTGGVPITLVQACVAYDKTMLSFVSIDNAGSVLNNETPADPSTDCASTDLQIGRYKTGSPYPSGIVVVAKITFKALKSNGIATISIPGAKSIVFDDSASGINILSSTTKSDITLLAIPPAAPGPAPTSHTPKASTPITTTTAAPGTSTTTTAPNTSTNTTTGSKNSTPNPANSAATNLANNTGNITNISTEPIVTNDSNIQADKNAKKTKATNSLLKTLAIVGIGFALLLGLIVLVVISKNYRLVRSSHLTEDTVTQAMPGSPDNYL